MRESHEGRALEFDDIGLVRMGQILDESADIGAGVRVRWAKIVVVRIAERVARDRARMEHAEPGVVKANRPARHLQPACVPPAHELPKNVSALNDDLGDLGLDRRAPPSARASGGNRLCRPRESRPFASGFAAGGSGRRDRSVARLTQFEARAVAHFAERRIEPDDRECPRHMSTSTDAFEPSPNRSRLPRSLAKLAASEAERASGCQVARDQSASMRYTRRALSWKSADCSASEKSLTIALKPSKIASKLVHRRPTGKSLPNIDRSTPKHSMQCSATSRRLSGVGDRIVSGQRRNLDLDVGRRAEQLQALPPSRHAVAVAIDRAAAMVDDEGLIGEVAREPGDLFGLVRIKHQLEDLVVASEQRDAAAKVRLVGDARPRREAFCRLGRMPAQHLPDADATLDLGQAVKRCARVRSGEVGEADITGGDARRLVERLEPLESRRADRRRGPRRLLCARRRPRSGWPRRAGSRRRDNFVGSARDRPAPESRLLWGEARDAGPCRDPTDGYARR